MSARRLSCVSLLVMQAGLGSAVERRPAAAVVVVGDDDDERRDDEEPMVPHAGGAPVAPEVFLAVFADATVGDNLETKEAIDALFVE